MLNIKNCRRILGGDAPQIDADLEAIRDALYDFARVVVERLPEKRRLHGQIMNSPMLAGIASLRLLVDKPSSVFGKYGLLFSAVSLARQQAIGAKIEIRY